MSQRRLKLLVLTSTFPRWNGDPTPRFVADLCGGLAKTMDVTVLAPGAQGAKAFEQWDNFKVRRFRYAWPSRAQLLADGAILPNIRRNRWLLAQVPFLVLCELWAAWRLMRRERFDVIHAHWAIPQGLVAALLKRRFGVPVVTTTHGGDIYALRVGPSLALKRFALRNSDRITAVSSALKAEVVALGIDQQRVDVLPMGVDTCRFTPEARSVDLRRKLNPSGPILLFVGRLVEKKGARYAIEAMPRIVAKHSGARLVLVGDGPEQPMLEQIARDLRVASNVTFLGAMANDGLPPYYASSDVFLGPSVIETNGDTESFGVVFAEAMASGCPVVATDVEGVGDVTGNGSHARLVPQRDALEIASAVSELLSDNHAHTEVRDRGIRAMREGFDHARIHAAYAQLIQRAARSHEEAPMLAEGIPMKRSHANADRAAREAKARGIEATLKEQVGDVRERDVLDVGTGAGYIASYLAPRCRSLLSVDVVDERVTRDFDFQLVTSETLPMPDSSFDLVISNHVIEHVDDQLLHLQEIRRVLRPGGVCYLATPNKYALLEPHFKLPLLSWLSPAVANLYVRMARKGQRFDVQPLAYSRLAALGKAADLDSSDYSAILARSQVKGLTGVTQCLTDRLHALFPTYVVILRPAQDTRARGDRLGE